MPFPPIRFRKHVLELLDQRLLPNREVWIHCEDSRKVHWAIREMVVRGAPAIGVAAGYGLYLGVKKFKGTPAAFVKKLRAEGEYLKSARPTGVNLRNIVDRIVGSVTSSSLRAERSNDETNRLKGFVLREARRAHEEDDRLCREMGRHGQKLIRSGDRVLTHCNAGGLATTGYGTALGVIYAAVERGKKLTVYADETRPLLQGARLTAWELTRSGIPCTLLCDNMAASLMREGKIDRIVVGADRIAANGDTANKIGTYGVAVLARAHKIPFYVAAPGTTFDFKISTGKKIPIEFRRPEEITQSFGRRTAPASVKTYNPAFDVTPNHLITAFITEAGVLRPPFKDSFRALRIQTH